MFLTFPLLPLNFSSRWEICWRTSYRNPSNTPKPGDFHFTCVKSWAQRHKPAEKITARAQSIILFLPAPSLPHCSRHRAGQSSAHSQCNNFHPMSSVKEKKKRQLKKTTESTLKYFFLLLLSKLNSPAAGEHLTQLLPPALSASLCAHRVPCGRLWVEFATGACKYKPHSPCSSRRTSLAHPNPWGATRSPSVALCQGPAAEQSHNLCPWVTSPLTDLFVRAPQHSGTCGFL